MNHITKRILRDLNSEYINIQDQINDLFMQLGKLESDRDAIQETVDKLKGDTP